MTVVAVSHLHDNHFGGLPYLLLDGQFRHRVRPLHLVGPPGMQQRLEKTMEALFPDSTRLPRRSAIHVHELPPDARLDLEQVTVQAFGVDHAAGAPALGLRLSMAGRVIACSGDTAWTDTLIELADGADLFLCEAYTASRRGRYHLDLPTLRANLHRVRSARLLLVHPSPDLLEQRDVLWLDLADDGAITYVKVARQWRHVCRAVDLLPSAETGHDPGACRGGARVSAPCQRAGRAVAALQCILPPEQNRYRPPGGGPTVDPVGRHSNRDPCDRGQGFAKRGKDEARCC